jgi:NTE family protein
MTTAFVLSGGASLGAIQVGMLQALLRWGARPDLVVGTSVGAVNGAWVAGHPGAAGADGLAAVWRGLRRADVFPSSPLRALTAVTGRSRAVVSPHGLRRSPMPSPSAPTSCGCCQPGTPVRCWRPRHPRSAWRCTG